MARLRRKPAQRTDVRGEVAARLRETAERIYPNYQWPTGPDPAGWLDQADALDAGEAVVVLRCQVVRHLDQTHPAAPAYRLEPDGSVTPMQLRHEGDAAVWVPDRRRRS